MTDPAFQWRIIHLMAYHPISKSFRFILEMIALYALGYWGWTQPPGILRYLLAPGLPILAIVIWKTFQAIEPVAPKPIPVTVQGRVRLALELGLTVLAALAIFSAGGIFFGVVFLLLVFLHYFTSIDRISWLLKPG